MKKLGTLFMFVALAATYSCSVDNDSSPQLIEDSSNSLFDQLSSVSTQSNRLPQPDVWADCIVYSGLVVPATFKPESDPFDELYVMPGYSFYNGIDLISDSKPGDKDYNGGRWHMNVLKAGVDPLKYANACAEEDLDLADFESTANYFECPLRPRRN